MKPIHLFAVLALSFALPLIARGQQPPPQQPQAAEIDPKADEILKKMGKLLADAKSLSFESHAIADQMTPDGQKLQFAKNQKVVLHRPDKLAADVIGDVDDLIFRYDGKHVALYNPRTHSWGAAEAPASIDATLDMLESKYGMSIPMADLVFPDPYDDLMQHVRSGQYVGLGYVGDIRCHHLAFRQLGIDWQIWIQDSDQPVPLKFVITFKESPGQPQYTAFMSNWNLSAQTPDSAFVLTPPADAKEVEFAPRTALPPAANAGSSSGHEASAGTGEKQ
jgi:hypothetical protein